MSGGFAGGGTGGGFVTGGGGAICTGCVLNGTCIDPTGTSVCGLPGSVCAPCPNQTDTCVQGQCTPSMGCSAATCPGCCSPAGPAGGQCIPLAAQLNIACGSGGQMCIQCPPGTNCSPQGSCVPGPPCGPGSCAGCCIQGTCLQPFLQSESACGSNGLTCAMCAAGQTCSAGQCVGGCSPATCPNGCCNGNGQCVPLAGQSSGQCGLGGQRCFACASNGQCVNGACVFSGCSAQTCNGCCVNNRCVPFSQQSANLCGFNGTACRACGAGASCTMGVCTTSSCSPANCSGCCLNGACIPLGQQPASACGQGGSVCAACPPNAICQNGLCVASGCSPATCRGCCSGGICNAGTTTTSCGVGGVTCQSCRAGTLCSGGSCVGFSDAGVSTDAGVVGSPCGTAAQCTGIPVNQRQCLPLPGGYCSAFCQSTMTTCTLFQSCPGLCPGAGSGGPSVCVGSGLGSPPVCGQTCPAPLQGQSTCRTGYVCATFGGSASTGLCIPSCTNGGFGCPAGGSCDLVSGYCQ